MLEGGGFEVIDLGADVSAGTLHRSRYEEQRQPGGSLRAA